MPDPNPCDPANFVKPGTRVLHSILAELRITVEMIELCKNLAGQGSPSPGILREAMERLEKIPPQIYNLLHQPKLGGKPEGEGQ